MKQSRIEYNRKWREQNKENIKKQQRIGKDRIKLNKIKSVEYLGGKCNRCRGIFHYVIYDFHHINPKEKDTTVAKILHCTWKRVKKELEKCLLLCSNCHRLIHYEENRKKMTTENDVLEAPVVPPSDPPSEPQVATVSLPNRYVLQLNPYVITAAELGAVLNALGVVINQDIYVGLDDRIKDLFKAVN